MNNLVITRVFSAPKQEVFRAWSDPDTLKKWWAPEGMEVSKYNVNFVEKGSSNYAFTVDGFTVYGKLDYLEIDEPNKLIFVDNFTDENGSIVSPSFYEMPGNSPNPMRVEVVFEDDGGATVVTMTITNQDGDKIDQGIEDGWNQMFIKLAKELQ